MRTGHLHSAIALCFFLSIIMLSSPRALLAQEETAPSSVPRVSFGVVGFYGLASMANVQSDSPNSGSGLGRVDQGSMYGGGLAFESMFNRYLGLHIELLYSYVHLDYKANEYESTLASYGIGFVIGTRKTETYSRIIVMPVYLMPSYTYRRFTAGMLLGVHLNYIFEAKYKSSGLSLDAMKYVNYHPVNIAGGLQFKFAVFRFVDVFLSVVAERGLTSYFDDADGSSERFIGLSARAGVLFRTF